MGTIFCSVVQKVDAAVMTRNETVLHYNNVCEGLIKYMLVNFESTLLGMSVECSLLKFKLVINLTMKETYLQYYRYMYLN